jgi:hypothetical protein
MGPVMTLDALYTSAPIFDDDEDAPQTPPEHEATYEGPGVATLAPDAFDAAILAALITP